MPQVGPITENGYGDLVIMSLESYKEMLETAATDTAIAEAEAEYARDDKLYDAKETLGALRRKRFWKTIDKFERTALRR